MSNVDADTHRAILNDIIATSENPLADIMANLCGGKSSGSVTVKATRQRSNSDDSDGGEGFRQFLARMESMVSESEESPAGPSSSSKGKEPEDSKEEPESLVDRVKREKLDEYERSFVESIVDTDKIDTSFESVYLPEDIIDTLRSLVSLPLMCPEEFNFGILKTHTMSGALLFGPPGTGKTLFAQAIAKESGANMIMVKPSDILDKCVGESEKLVRGLFKLARRLHPCVVFIDELDALFGSRTHAGQQSSARWHTSMLTEFMQEMDGLMSSKVVVIGATNRPFDLDDAVLRRLPCRVMIDLPDQIARHEILKILLREEALAKDVNLESLAGRTDRYSGSDLKNLCVAAAINSVKENVSVPWKTGSKKGKERAPGQTFARFDQPSANNPVLETTGARIVEVTDDDSSDGTPKTTPASTESSTDASSAPSPTDPKPFTASRVLANKHFSHALTQVGPSSSDTQSTLGEIRAWNAKFGSGENKMSGIPGYSGSTGVPPYNPSGAGTGIPGYGARPGGSSNLYGSSGIGSGIPGIGSSSSTGIPGYGSSSGTGIPGYGGSSNTGIPGYGSSSSSGIPGIGGSSGMGVPGVGPSSGTGIPGYDAARTGTGMSGIPGYGAAGSGTGMSGFSSNTGTGIPGITSAGTGAGAGGNSMGYAGIGGAGVGGSGYGASGTGMNFGAGALGGGRDMSWLQRPGASAGLGLGDGVDYNSITAAAS